MMHPNCPPVDQPFYLSGAAAPPQYQYSTNPPPRSTAVVVAHAKPYYSSSNEEYGNGTKYEHAASFKVGNWPQTMCPAAATPVVPASVVAKPVPMAVVGPQYCLPQAVDLVISRKVLALTNDFVVTNVKNEVMFRVKGKLLSLRDQRVLLDAAGKPVLTLRQMIMTAHNRWQVFKGGSTYPSDLMFSARNASLVQFKTKLNVYLANRLGEDACDFRVEGNWTERSCVVYVGESSTVAAQINKQSFFLGKTDTFTVKVSPNIDHAFVVALIMILDATPSPSDVLPFFNN